ncbi:MAG TPA: glycosyltransferase [Steroidobacteraceae bacterium]|nr:glycosyltransferase [Steroidobacteraceae bacterium]
MRVAVIIPTLDDDTALQRLIARLGRLDPAPHEVLVVDGAASETCEALCRGAGAVWIAAHPSRGGQLALGAARAPAEVLWFLHPECEPHPASIAAIRDRIDSGAAGGYFRFHFGGPPNATKRFLEQCIALRCRWGMVYGDQGLFVTRAAYEATPGFTVQPLFEEVALVRALKRTRRFAGLDLPITVSARRWERDGFFRRTLANRMLALGFLCGASPARLARWYGGRLRPAPAGYGSRAGGRSRSGGHEAHKG